ncbi:hypothetical protein BGZ96_007965 [Linnemannia gamsii]|uniref:Ankyrin n=1 Tax=Linnemannia gamsii TaxID=64522 RepID=A0ABQ7K1D9_9FUNG|nr:hypothetical protein BGZ96_007965 [Linnemannia gamsii]
MSDEEGASYNELLVAACKEDNLDLLEKVLSADASSFDVNHTDGLGNAALHYAARHGSTGCLEILLYYDGIDVNVINRIESETPLHKAAAYPDPDIALEMVQILVNGGASTKLLNKMKQTPADKAPSDTHAEVKECLMNAGLGSMVDARDIAPEDSDTDGVASDED